MDLLEQHFEAALTVPDGIEKLRGLILTLAMQGRITSQLKSDQSSHELYNQISTSRKKLISEKKLRTNKYKAIEKHEQACSIPDSWKWVRFGEIAFHNAGKTLDKKRNSGTPREYITTSNLYWGKFKLDNLKQMAIQEHELERCTTQKGDLLICEGGEAGRAAVWDFDHSICFQNHIHRARFDCNINPYFAYRFFEKLTATGEINLYRKGIGISNMSGKALGSIPFPLPPLEEQNRIVTKIDELMARCDELEQLRAQRDKKRISVNSVAIKELLSSNASSSFEHAWSFIRDHFTELYSTKENVDELRKAILQLAVMGKLVPQDSSEEPANKLLKRIEAEKQQLLKEKKIKKQKKLTGISEDEKKFTLPKGWAWVKIGDLALSSGAGWSPSCEKRERIGKEWGVLKVSAVTWGKFNPNENKALPISLLPRPEIEVKDGDFILSRANTAELVARSVVVSNPPSKLMLSDKLVRYQFPSCISTEFCNIANNCFFSRDYYKSKATGTSDSMRNVSRETINNLVIALPPLKEQIRIVAKVKQLTSTCAKLETYIDRTSSSQARLLNSVLTQL